VPATPWFVDGTLNILVGGVLPFGAVFVEVFYVLSSIWLHQFYYLFGFLFLVLVILLMTCAEITIVMCYFQVMSSLVSTCLVSLYGTSEDHGQT
jgi:transmembrane 9 superfamily protein 2/4